VTIIVGFALEQRAPALIGFFAMGAFLFAAITQMLRGRIPSSFPGPPPSASEDARAG
jgi:hypothetical protein